MNFLKYLSEVAAATPDPEWRDRVKYARGRLELALKRLADDATPDNLQTVNGLWARAKRIVAIMPPLPEGRPSGARMKEAA